MQTRVDASGYLHSEEFIEQGRRVGAVFHLTVAPNGVSQCIEGSLLFFCDVRNRRGYLVNDSGDAFSHRDSRERILHITTSNHYYGSIRSSERQREILGCLETRE